jgi:hypothetical protein
MRAYAVAEDGNFISGTGGQCSTRGLIVSAATNTAATSNPITDLQGALGACLLNPGAMGFEA